MNFTSYSQAGQDKFIHHVLGGMCEGIFIDCGCNHPIEKSNTYALESALGWRGLLVDNDQNCVDLCKQHRSAHSKVFMGDGTTADWAYGIGSALSVFNDTHRPVIDYLSLDCDAATLPTLCNIMEELGVSGRRICAMTVEHDRYRFGDHPRDAMVKLLTNHGYDILCADIMDQGLSFEIWAVDPKLVDMKLAERFRRDKPTEWKEFFV